jgi:hypothetical protein
MTETISRPSGDVSTPWGTATPHWSKINESITQPTAGDGTYIRADENDDNEVEEFDMADVDLGTDTVSQIIIWIYSRSSSKNYDYEIDIYWNSAWVGYQFVPVENNNTWEWFSVTFGSLSGGDTEADALKVRIRSDSSIGKNGYIDIDTLYAVITHTPASQVCLDCKRPGGIMSGVGRNL